MSEGTKGWSAQSYEQRLQRGGMGDEAESVFEEVHKEAWVRFGFNRPPFRMTHLSSFVRHTPDYCDRFGLWDCMGLGRDGVLKVKVEKVEALMDWDRWQQTGLFVWNSAVGAYAYLSADVLLGMVELVGDSGIRSFNDGNRYYPIEWTEIERRVVVVTVS